MQCVSLNYVSLSAVCESLSGVCESLSAVFESQCCM